MADYQPVDISKWCNAGVDIVRDEVQDIALGPQTLRGLPFLVGAEASDGDDKCFIAVEGSDGSVTVPVNKRARRVIFAHRQLETSGTVGAGVGEYVFRLSDGAEERVPLRERFEIGLLG